MEGVRTEAVDETPGPNSYGTTWVAPKAVGGVIGHRHKFQKPEDIPGPTTATFAVIPKPVGPQIAMSFKPKQKVVKDVRQPGIRPEDAYVTMKAGTSVKIGLAARKKKVEQTPGLVSQTLT